MNILDNLNKQYEIVSSEPASSEEEIRQLVEFSKIEVPQEYLNIIRQQANIKMVVKNRKYDHSIRIHGAFRCINMNKSLLMQKYMPESLMIGYNGGSVGLVYATTPRGFGVYASDWESIDINEAVYLSKSLESLLVYGDGIDVMCEEFLAK